MILHTHHQMKCSVFQPMGKSNHTKQCLQEKSKAMSRWFVVVVVVV